MNSLDPNSLSNLDEVVTKHVHLNLSINFAEKALSGFAVLDVLTLTDNVSELVLDTSELIIKSVAQIVDGNESKLDFSLDTPNEQFGVPLRIKFNTSYPKDTKLTVKVYYSTTEKSGACQFLTPEQTKGKKHPFLFTQCQSIHARSLYPCQDSPSNKITYSGEIRCPKPLTALMSAIGTRTVDDGDHTIFHYEQKIATPSYLVVVACGNLERRELGPRSAVWSEPELADACEYEFGEMERIIDISEATITPYVWGRYDLLVLPPSFPFGGMENPCLSFITPTMIAGDRSLVDLISHELAHSWSGNLVTTKNWEHFWLNEGWTTYFERKLTEKVNSRDTSQLLSVLGLKSMTDDIERYGTDSALTQMVPDLKNVHPDDAFCTIPYEKGYNFLYYLESLLSPEVWTNFYRSYIHEFSGKSIDTNDFKNFLYGYVKANVGDEGVAKLDSVDWESWLYKPGYPPVSNDFDKTPQVAPLNLAERWVDADDSTKLNAFAKSEFDSLFTHQKLVFLNKLGTNAKNIPHSTLEKLDSVYSLSYHNNFEVRAAWLYVALEARYTKVFDAAVSMVEDQGRMKFTRPVYRLLNALKEEGGDELAKKTFLRLENTYHPICSRLVRSDLGL